jgi:hypothetical protein
MFKLTIFLAMLFISYSLKNEQWVFINNILKNKNMGFSNNIIQQKTRNLIYESYENWAIKQSHVFKQYHTYLCRDISGHELAIYGCIGLKKAVDNYDPNKCGLFTRYADFYLKNALYKGVRKLKPINSIKCEDYVLENIYLKPETNDILDIYINKNMYNDKWIDLGNRLNSFEFRCVTYKYSFEFDKKMTNEKVAELMCCSEESVRKVMTKLDI